MENAHSVRPLRRALWTVAALLCTATASPAEDPPQVILRGDTSEPVLSTFVLGEPVELRFEASGLQPGAELSLKLRTLDEHDEVVSEQVLAVKADERGRWNGKAPGSSDRLGFRRVEAGLSDGTALQALGSRKGSYLTYAVVPDPQQRRDYGPMRSRFGMQGGFGREWANRSVSLLGARWVLDGSFEWRRNEPNRPGEYAEALAKNPPAPASHPWRTYALPTLMATPKWAAVPETLSYMTGALKPEYEQAWQDYCRLAVQAFMRKYPEQKPRVYQITWEPQTPWGYKGRLQDLVRIYELAYPVIHETDPDAIVAGPTLGLHARSELQTMSDLLALRLADYLDGFTTHPYFPFATERAGMIDHVRQMNRMLDATGKSLPRFGTEQGGSTFEKRELELHHARALVRQNLIMLGEGYTFNLTYYIVDYYLANQSGYGYYYNLVDKVPWGPAKAGPRPVVPAYAAQSLLLDGSDSVRAINWLGETAWGYAFERDGEVILALWDYGDQTHEVSLPVGSKRVQVYDWMGNPRDVETSPDYKLPLTLGPEPVYITGASTALWGRDNARTLHVEPDMTVTPGMELVVEVTIESGQAISGSLTMTPDARLGIGVQEQRVGLAAGERGAAKLALRLPANTEPGDYPMGIALVDERGTRALAGQWLHVVPPVAVERVQPVLAQGGAAAVCVTLRDAQGSGQQGQMRLEVPGLIDAVVAPYALAPGGTSSVTVPLSGAAPQPMRKYAVKVSPLAAQPDRFAQTQHVNWYAPPRLNSPPRIDGDLSDWSEIPAQKTGSITSRIAWDTKTIYIGIETVDEVFIQTWDSHNTARGDSVVINVNLDPDRDGQRSGNELADAGERPRTSRFALALTRNGTELYRHGTPNADALPTGLVAADHARAAVKREDDRLIYELAISLAALGGEAITPGQSIAIAIEVRDLDVEDWHQCAGTPLFKALEKGVDNTGLLQLGFTSED